MAPRWMAVGAVVLALLVGGGLLWRAVEARRPRGTDAEQIRALLLQGELAAERGDAPGVGRLLSERYNDGYFNYARARAAIGDYLRRHRRLEITIPGESISFSPGPDGRTGSVSLRLRLRSAEEPAAAGPEVQLTLEVVKEPVRYFGLFPGEEWRILSAGGYEGLE